jgi:hypothetical protein
VNIFFSFLSAAYIAGIFFFADSPLVSDVATFNPYSLLHIPLYGILTFLVILSFSPQRKRFVNPTNSTNPSNSSNPMNPINPMNPTIYLIGGFIALVVAIADEFHQAYLPARNASIIDVFLDIIGIILCVALIRQLRSKSRFSNIMVLMSRMTKKRGQL